MADGRGQADRRVDAMVIGGQAGLAASRLDQDAGIAAAIVASHLASD